LPKQNLPGTQRAAKCSDGENQKEEETITRADMYAMLVKKGVIGSNGQLDWCSEDTEEGKRKLMSSG
jgi:hypothetical protein